METKLRQLMKHEGINSTRLAEILGIQASGISHIMSGRNKPSFDFLQKLLQRFPQINPDWLLLDKGPMYRDEIKNKSVASGPGARTGGQVNPSGVSGYSGSSHGTGGVSSGADGGTGRVGDGGIAGGLRATDAGNAVQGGAYGAGSTGHGVRASAGMGQEGAHGTVGGNTGGWLGASGSRMSDINASYNAGGGGAGGLFGPDNNDIIHPGGSQYGNRTGNQDVYRAENRGGGHQRPEPYAPTHVDSGQQYDVGAFMRSSAVERIVVFYKDKTFSEYQPG